MEKYTNIQDVLSEEQLEVLRLRYQEGLTQAETGRVLGKLRQRITEIEKGALAKLRRYKHLDIDF